MASTFERIVVPIDESDPSRAASRLALEVAGSYGGHLVLCHVLDTRDLYDNAATYGYGPRPLVAQMRAEAEELLDGATNEAHARRIRCGTRDRRRPGSRRDPHRRGGAQSEFDRHWYARAARVRAPLRRQHDRRRPARDRDPTARRACPL
jgi:hypothetical protein